MLPVWKLERLPVGQRRRKLALLLTDVERSLVRDADLRVMPPADTIEYLLSVVDCTLKDEKLSTLAVADITRLRDEARLGNEASFLRLCNHTRNALLSTIGTFPAEWDLVMNGDTASRGTNVSATSGLTGSERPFHPGLMVYAEDIRSPFNLGSIFRTAEAFGAEKVFLSPLCTPPNHPRAVRSAMGCIDYLPWETVSLADLPGDVPVFALETGGTTIGSFDFPEKGIVIIGSEELGVSPEALERASYGRVSIPMTGIKASLNVGVAFGILMQCWTAYLPCSVSKPF
jgi:RNA methyltransferase, TrmH family